MKTLFSLVFVLFLNSVQGQITTYEDVNRLKNRILLIGLEEEDENIIRKLRKKPQELIIYKNDLKTKNERFEQSVKEYWIYNEEILSMPLSEANKLLNQDIEKYAIIRFGKLSSERIGSYFSNSSFYKPKEYSNANRIEIDTPTERVGVLLPFYSEPFPKYIIDYAIKQAHYTVNYIYENKGTALFFKKYNSELQEKVLLIPEIYMDKSLHIVDINKLYPYEYKIVSLETIERVILNSEPDSAYLMIVPVPVGGDLVYYHYISNPLDGKVYGLTSSNKPVVKKKNIQKYAAIANTNDK